ncbi:CCA tRNA nucleotidyltransferase [Cohnella sp. GCM10027633]|uniref:CCA tRNA nucleotidyltransferase n=1 Tax=unclassified Cohnella TaxID=2636738 RepID=UPI00362AE0F1
MGESDNKLWAQGAGDVDRKLCAQGAEEADRKLWAQGMKLLRVLAEAGHEAYLVGGCVRDRLIGRQLHDIDIATSALPEQVQELFPRTLPTGLQHGTVTVMADGAPFELTTYRTESGYSDSRRPDEVAFVRDVKEDLARRDFTFNAMAVGLDGELLDPFGGRDDLAAGIVRTVGRAEDRFGEDALRMVRAIRFGAELGFALSADTWGGIASRRERLANVAMERIGAEWDKMMAGSGPDLACAWLRHSGLLAYAKEAMPAVKGVGADELQEGEWAAKESGVVGSLRLADIQNVDARWAAFWIGVGATEADALQACKTLRMSGKRGSRIAGIVGIERRLAGESVGAGTSGLALIGGCDRGAWIEAVLDYGVPVAEDWLAIRDAVRGVAGANPKGGGQEDIRKHGGDKAAANGGGELPDERQWLAYMPIARIGELAVRGDELSKLLDRPPGPWVAKLLRQLLSEVAHGRLANNASELAEGAGRLAEEEGERVDPAK